MKRFLSGLVVGLILATTTLAGAGSNTVKLKVNGKYIEFSEAPPQIINGRTMVPARPLAEALGAKVEWDGVHKTVIITSHAYPTSGTIKENDQEDSSMTEWLSLDQLLNDYGVSITVGDNVTLEKNAKIISFPTPRQDGQVTSLEGSIFEVKNVHGRIHIEKSFLQQAGFIN